MHAIVGLSVSQARTNWSDKWCTAKKWTSCVEAVSDPSSVITTTSHNSSDHFKTQQNVAGHIHLFIYHALDGATLANMLHFDTKGRQQSALPHSVFVTEMSLVFSVGGGGNCWRTRGWVADWRQAVISLSLPAWHLPTAANLLLISSRPCAWQRRGFQISFSPRVKNPEPYHFVNGYL